MSTTNSTLELFALKSYVSVLPETKREIALRIVGGHGGDPPPYPIGSEFRGPEHCEWADYWDAHDCYTHVWYDQHKIIREAAVWPKEPGGGGGSGDIDPDDDNDNPEPDYPEPDYPEPDPDPEEEEEEWVPPWGDDRPYA
jgi:hypothetical protein